MKQRFQQNHQINLQPRLADNIDLEGKKYAGDRWRNWNGKFKCLLIIFMLSCLNIKAQETPQEGSAEGQIEFPTSPEVVSSASTEQTGQDAPEAEQELESPTEQAVAESPETPSSEETVPIALHLENADLLQVISIIAAELQINYVVDPDVSGTVNINTLGQLRREDLFPLFQMILRINGATAVQSGNLYRIVPLRNVQRIPLESLFNASREELSPEDRMVMNIIPLRFVSATDMTKILTPFLSEGGHLFSHDSGNVLIVTDSSHSMGRLLDLVARFDSEVFSKQRARLYTIKNNWAESVAAELREVFSAYGLSSGTSAIRFVSIGRVNSVLVITANPSVYPEIEQWLERLDQPSPETGIRTFVYKVENARAEDLASVLSQLLLGTAASSQSDISLTGSPNMGGILAQAETPSQQPLMVSRVGQVGLPSSLISGGVGFSHIRIVPDPVNNQLLIQATAQEYEEIQRTLESLDIVPRQVMIEAKIYEVDLIGDLSAGVSVFLQNRSAVERKPLGSFGASQGGSSSLDFSLGTLVGKTRELLLFLNAASIKSQARVISAPSILASDNIPASINVGIEVPILTSQAVVGGTQVAGQNLFTNTIENRDTGVLLQITPRISSSGLVNLQIQQEVSAPLAPFSAGIQSPSIQKRSISTQVVVNDGETIAIAGIIQENRAILKNRIPLLGDIPYVGALFGNTSLSSQRTELIVLLTPTVIHDNSEAQRATAEFREKLKDLQKLLLEEERERESQEASDNGS